MKNIRCSGTNIDGTRCKNTHDVEDDIDEWYCFVHDPERTDKTKSLGKRKLNDHQREQVLEWLAEFKMPLEIKNLVKEKFDIDLSTSTISQYKYNQKEKIDEIRIKLNKDIAKKVPYANKFQRVKKLNEIVTRAEQVHDYKNLRLCIKDIAEEMAELNNSDGLANIKAYIDALQSSDIWADS